MGHSLAADWWWMALATVCLAASLGFAAGFYCARLGEQRAYRRARTGVTRLFQTMLESIDASRDLCEQLERLPECTLQPEQVERLDRRRTGLLEALTRLVKRHVTGGSPADDSEVATAPAVPQEINWLKDPTDSTTGLPDRPAFDQNLTALLEMSRAARLSSCVLMVRIDRMSGLVTRLGAAPAAKLLRKLSGVICRGVRDQDLVCKCNADVIGVLMPHTTTETAERISRFIRDAVRGQQFRIDETGQEVLLTASFGLTHCHAGDTPETVVGRAIDALSRSQRLGRNQLHIHDGESLHCAAV